MSAKKGAGDKPSGDTRSEAQTKRRRREMDVDSLACALGEAFCELDEMRKTVADFDKKIRSAYAMATLAGVWLKANEQGKLAIRLEELERERGIQPPPKPKDRTVEA